MHRKLMGIKTADFDAIIYLREETWVCYSLKMNAACSTKICYEHVSATSPNTDPICISQIMQWNQGWMRQQNIMEENIFMVPEKRTLRKTYEYTYKGISWSEWRQNCRKCSQERHDLLSLLNTIRAIKRGSIYGRRIYHALESLKFLTELWSSNMKRKE